MEKKLVSIIIPTYNRADLIKETIISVLNQTYQNFEVLIIDDGSTDNTKSVVKSFKDERIKYIWHKHYGIPAKTRNRGIKSAKGEYIAFLDSDDLWLPQKLEKQISYIEKNNNLLLISTNGFHFPVEPNYIILPLKINKIFSLRELLKQDLVITSSVLMKREIIDAIGLMDENVRDYKEDYDYWLRILKYRDKSILVLKDPLIKYRLHETSFARGFISEKGRFEDYKGLKYVFNKHLDNNRDYIIKLLKQKIKRYLLFQNKISLFFFFKDNDMNVKEKILFAMHYYYLTFLHSLGKYHSCIKIIKLINALKDVSKVKRIRQSLKKNL